MPKVFTSKNQKIGELGEDVACKFLIKKDFLIVERNYTKKWGEIDIVAQKGTKTYFIEVKSVTRLPDGKAGEISSLKSPQRETYRPEENMHPGKLRRLSRTIQTYLLQKDIGMSGEWQVDLICVYLDMNARQARVVRTEDIIL